MVAVPSAALGADHGPILYDSNLLRELMEAMRAREWPKVPLAIHDATRKKTRPLDGYPSAGDLFSPSDPAASAWVAHTGTSRYVAPLIAFGVRDRIRAVCCDFLQPLMAPSRSQRMSAATSAHRVCDRDQFDARDPLAARSNWEGAGLSPERRGDRRLVFAAPGLFLRRWSVTTGWDETLVTIDPDLSWEGTPPVQRVPYVRLSPGVAAGASSL